MRASEPLLKRSVLPCRFRRGFLAPILLDLPREVGEEHLALLPMAWVGRAQQPGDHCIFLERFGQVVEARPCPRSHLLLQEVHLLLDIAQSLHRLLLCTVEVENCLSLASRLVQFGVSSNLVVDPAYLGIEVDSSAYEEEIVYQADEVEAGDQQPDLVPDRRGTHPLDKLRLVEHV